MNGPEVVETGRGRTILAAIRRARSAPEAVAWLALVVVAAAWAARSGTLPARLVPVHGVAVTGLVFACLYVGLSAAYLAAAAQRRRSVRGVWSKVGLSVLGALLVTQLGRLVLAPLLEPARWSDCFYLGGLLPLAAIAASCAAFMPAESRALRRRVGASPALTPLPALAVLVAVAAVLVSAADLAFQLPGGGVVESRLRHDVILPSAWAASVLILSGAGGVVFALARRLTTALLVVAPLYAAFVIATLAKIRYMHSALQPLDLTRIPELAPLLRSFFGAGAVVALFAAAVVWLGALVASWRLRPARMSLARLSAVGLLSLVALLAYPAAFWLEDRYPGLSPVMLRLGAPAGQHREKARRNGVLLSFLSELPIAFVSAPPEYTAAAVADALQRYARPAPGVAPVRAASPVSLVVYVVESLVDPYDLAWRYTADPMPTVRALRDTATGGYGIVPDRFGGSASTEFEALTGMTRAFLPEGSVPYRQYLRRPVPSLPETLHRLGYRTTAVQADPKYYYDRERAYGLLGFDRVVWLDETPGVERAIRGHWVSDTAVVDAVIRASRDASPFFVFAFPTSTHSPYTFGTYGNSDLDLLDRPAGDAAAEVREYVNAVRVADRAIGALIEHFSQRPEPTIVAIFGDHLPPLSGRALEAFWARLARAPAAEHDRMTRRVPLVVWANFPLDREPLELSISALPSYLLERMGIARSGFFAVSDAVRRLVPVLASQAAIAGRRPAAPAPLSGEARAVLDDYRLLQYDLLLGRQYARHGRRDGSTGLVPSVRAMR